MSKKILFAVMIALFIQSCNRDDKNSSKTGEKEVESLAEQNTNDDKAIEKYLDEHYLNSQGVVTKFDKTDTRDDNEKKLSDLNPKKLENGIIIIKREKAQPANGKTIGATDILHIMTKTQTFLSQKEASGNVSYTSELNFVNTIDASGVPEKDPYYYYVNQSVLDKATTNGAKQRSYYEIEGFQEGLKEFKAFDKSDNEGYNLQGVIIVPSRLAYARDPHYLGIFRNRNFVFNFQIYKAETR